MGPDRISSYNNIKDYPGSIGQGSFKQSGKLPFERDVLMAMEKGDLNEAMRLVKLQAELSKNPFILTRLVQGLKDKLAFPQLGKFPDLLKKEIVDRVITLLIKSMNLISFKALQKALELKLLKATLFSPLKMLAKLQNIAVRMLAKSGELAKQKFVSKVVKPIVSALHKGAEAFKRSMVDPVVKWITPKAEYVREKVDKQLERLKEKIESAVDKLDAATKPLREQAAELAKTIAERYNSLQELSKEKVLTPIKEKISEVKEKLTEVASSVKESASEALQSVIHHMQNLPVTAAPFALWVMKQTIAPVGNIKENILHFAKKTKSGLKWMGEKSASAGKFLMEGGEILTRKLSQGWSWFKDRFVPFILGLWLRIKENLRKLSLWLWKLFVVLSKKLAGSVKSSFRYIQGGARLLKSIIIHRIKVD